MDVFGFSVLAFDSANPQIVYTNIGVTPIAQRLNPRTIAIASVVLLLAGFMLGFVPQFRTAAQLRSELRGREEQIHGLEREARLWRTRDLASLIYLELTRRNYGIAARHSTALFDNIQSMRSDSMPEARGGLEKLLSHKDAVMGGIAKSDPAVLSLVQQISDELHALKTE